MSRKQKIKHMTPEELKSKLYTHFQKTGSLDHLRSQLRGQLVSELFKVAEPLGPDTFPNASDISKCVLPLQVCNWLVYDHLSRQDYQYSLSTFVSEAHLPYPEKFLTAGDIMKLLGLNHSTSEFENICKLYTENNELECLHSLLLSIIKSLFNVPNRVSVLNQGHNLNEINNSSKKDILNDHEESAHSVAENKQTLTDFAVNESLKSRKLSVDRSFIFSSNEKLAEMSFHEQLQSVKEENEKEVQKLRHKLLEELENLHSQERKMQLEIEFTKTELRKEQNKLLKEKELFKEKEMLFEKEMDHKFEMKRRDLEEDFASKFHFKDKELEALKMRLSEKEQKLLRINTELSGEKDNNIILRKELDDIKHMYKIVQDKYSLLLDENTNILKKFENMSDYSILKEELSAKSKEVLRLQQEIKGIHQRSESERKKYVETVRNLEDTLNMKEPQLIEVQKELDHMRNTFSSEEVIWTKEKKYLEQELNEFKGLYKTVIQRMEDQNEDIHDLQKTIQVLNYKLSNNPVNMTKPKSSVPYRTFQRATENLQNKPASLFIKRNIFSDESSEDYKDFSLQFISDAKSRLGKLKQEEHEVQEKYSYFFSALPENKKPDNYFDNFSLFSPKKPVDSYNATIFKSSFAASNADKWSANKVPSNFRSPYTLTDVKKMVSRTLFSDKIGEASNLVDNSYLDVLKIPNRFNDVLKESKTNLELYNRKSIFDPKATINSTDINHENVPVRIGDSLSHNVQQSNSELHNRQSSFDPKASIADGDILNSEIASIGIGDSISYNMQMTSSADKGMDQRIEIINPVEKEFSEKNIHSDNFQDNVQTLGKTDNIETISSVLPSMSKNMSYLEKHQETIEQVSSDANQNNSASQKETVSSVSNLLNEETLEVLNATKTKPDIEQPTVFVNLDAAWKRRSSSIHTPSLDNTDINVTNLKDNSNFLISSLTSMGKTYFNSKQGVSDNGEETNKSENQTNVKSKEQSDLHITETISAIDSQANTQNIIPTSNVQLEDENIIESKTIVEKNSGLEYQPFSDSLNVKQVNKGVDASLSVEEQNNTKSSEKVGSADSMSELSEVHLSCGSEPEQQKEDSNEW